MWLRLLLVPVLLLTTSTSTAADAQTQSRTRVGDWTLIVRRDLFSGSIDCQLTARRKSYELGTIVLHMPRDVDTSTAIYRIDGGRPTSIAEDRLVLVGLGIALWRDDLNNPSDGLVRIPVTKLTSARVVEVETSPHRLWRIPLGDLADALAAYRRANCG